jgi:hypothetical protein
VPSRSSLIWINTAKNRIKDQNMRRDKRVAISILDPDNAYRHVAIRGEVAEITENGADAHIDAMAKKYLGKDRYPFRSPSEVRVIYKIRPVKSPRWDRPRISAPHAKEAACLVLRRLADCGPVVGKFV